jgi:hypothetical protein
LWPYAGAEVVGVADVEAIVGATKEINPRHQDDDVIVPS